MVACCALIVALALVAIPALAQVEPFVGRYVGSAEVQRADGTTEPRDMSVEIAARDKGGFRVAWTTVTYRADGKSKTKSYEVEFLPTEREGIYSAAMETNLFGHAVQLDPMKGEPYVWGRIKGDTMTVYSLYIDQAGEWEMQQFDRTLAEGGLVLNFSALRNGEKQRTVETFLERVE
ncbi:MAG TPA: hypothetical protein DEA05_05215 [Rhodobacteraceae bacterium]|nr:hypothetical protein [Paracoccaceae bacterium]